MDVDRQGLRFAYVPEGNLERRQLQHPQRARLARQVQIVAPAGTASIANLVVNAEPIGSLSENVGLLDLRVAKRFGIGQGRTFELRLDLFQRDERESRDVNRRSRRTDVRKCHGVCRRRSEWQG